MAFSPCRASGRVATHVSSLKHFVNSKKSHKNRRTTCFIAFGVWQKLTFNFLYHYQEGSTHTYIHTCVPTCLIPVPVCVELCVCLSDSATQRLIATVVTADAAIASVVCLSYL